MSSTKIVNDVGAILLEAAQRDCVGLWVVLWEVKQLVPAIKADEARAFVLTTVHRALKQGAIVTGGFVEHDEEHLAFVPWTLTADDAIARIDREWSELGREPNLGEVAWFVAPNLLPLIALKHPMGRDWKPV